MDRALKALSLHYSQQHQSITELEPSAFHVFSYHSDLAESPRTYEQSGLSKPKLSNPTSINAIAGFNNFDL